MPEITWVSRSQLAPASVDNIKKRYLVVDDPVARIRSPSYLSQPENTCQLDKSKFALHRPPSYAVLPLALLHPIFAEFVANIQLYEPTGKDCALVLELRQVMLEPWEDTAIQFHKFRQILAKHYKIQLYAAEVGATKRTTKGHAQVGDYIYVVFEMNGWTDGGDPAVRASRYPLEAFRPVIRDKMDPYDMLPCIIVCCIGTMITFSGTVITDRFQLQCLTPGFHLNTPAHEFDKITNLARAFGAFKIVVEKLRNHYENVTSRSTHDLQTPERQLRVTFPYPDSYETERGRIEFTYDYRFHDSTTPAFVATTTEGTKVLVKFTHRYSEEAHRFCAEAGVAPGLLGFRSLQAGWYMAVMEYLEPQSYRMLGPDDGSNHGLVAEIRRVVAVLHDGGFVHGDIRDVNMMTRHPLGNEEEAQKVLLLDFHWAGPKGVMKYPYNLNIETVKRHEGAKGGALITQEHDLFMVNEMFNPVVTASHWI